jgi:hypothetical protein
MKLSLLKANGEDVKTVQELLRHANSRITLDGRRLIRRSIARDLSMAEASEC